MGLNLANASGTLLIGKNGGGNLYTAKESEDHSSVQSSQRMLERL